MNLSQSIRDLLSQVGPGQMESTAYDTAWIARLSLLGEPIGQDALDWLREHQLADGSWGAESPVYYHDRLVCTLSAAIALASQGNSSDAERLERAKNALETVIPMLADQAGIETCGFEMIVPTLFSEAESLGIIQRWNNADMKRLDQQRAAKLAALPGGLINRFVTLAFSAEMAGSDGLHLLDIEHLQEINGSVGHSPSATAYFVLNVDSKNQPAFQYIRQLPVQDGGIPDLASFDIYEPTWVLWNLSLLNSLDADVKYDCERHLDNLARAWRPGKGIGLAMNYTPPDGDETSVVYEILTQFGRSVDIETVLSYEGPEYFRCYALEANPSISTNIHVLSALRKAGFPPDHPSVRKIILFLASAQFWFDKWHVSPYYTTSHAVIACAGYVDDLVMDAVSWILATQNQDGSWGYYMPTPEETAYCLQALTIWRRNGHAVPAEVLKRGSEWLAAHINYAHPSFWIGKCLYHPVLIVRAAILSALALVSEELGISAC